MAELICSIGFGSNRISILFCFLILVLGDGGAAIEAERGAVALRWAFASDYSGAPELPATALGFPRAGSAGLQL